MKKLSVVAAVITHNGKYLCALKGEHKYAYLSHKYEFPGGKVEPYQKIQPDANKQDRTVWIFPLRLLDTRTTISAETIVKASQKKQRKYKRKSTEQLIADAKASAQTEVSYRNTQTKYYIRSDSIAQLAKRFANGICQLCEQPAPFKDANGEPYLETHHIEWLAHGGADTVKNTVALCPNCHKKMHIVNAEADRSKLKGINNKP